MEHHIPLISRKSHDEPIQSAVHIPTDDFMFSELGLEKVHEQRNFRYQLPTFSDTLQWKTWSVSASNTRSAVLLSYLAVILPRFMRRKGWKQANLGHTAWLDALRGWAAVSVYYFHTYYDFTQSKMGQPFLAGFLNGRAMVQVFFVISGYAISIRILKLMRHCQDSKALLRALASSTFRRWFRLFASAGFASFVMAMFVHLRLVGNEDLWQETLLAQIWDWLCDFGTLANPFAPIEGWWHPNALASNYLNVLWTIPAEFRGSIAVFWFLTASTPLSDRGRRIFGFIVILLCYLWGALFISSFLVGMLIADFDVDRGSTRHLPQELSMERSKQRIEVKIGYGCLLTLAIFLLSQPTPEQYIEGNWRPFPWNYLLMVIPNWYDWRQGEEFWLSIGSAALVVCISSLPLLQVPLNFRFSQNLGYLSFGIYTMHIVVKNTVFDRFIDPWTSNVFGGSWMGSVLGNVPNTIVLFWAADLFARVDARVVKLGRWIEQRSFMLADAQ